jgi:16S rRNA (cytosine967-C5)-methyltransferase
LFCRWLDIAEVDRSRQDAEELHPHRASLLRRLAGAGNVSVVAADARHLPVIERFDRVLADVPCSGTGTLAHNPEIKWRLRAEDLTQLSSRQFEILEAAFDRVALGGRVLYSTCSLEPEENELVVERLLAKFGTAQLADCRDELRTLQKVGDVVIEDTDSLITGKYLRTIPGVHPCEGFFAAILQKS